MKTPLPQACLCLLLAGLLPGCQTGEPVPAGELKTRGVYTTLAPREPALDLPPGAWVPRSSFGPGETPAAVALGYGTHLQPEQITLELVETASGRTLLSQDCSLPFGKALVRPLPIRLSGDYRVRLLVRGTEFDAACFTVRRDATPVPPATDYARGVFTVNVEWAGGPATPDYNHALVYSLVNAVIRESSRAAPSLFVQRPPGCVVIQAWLDAQGAVTEPRIAQNTLDSDCGAALLQSITSHSPYRPWPEEMRRRGPGPQPIRITIRFD